MPKQRFQFYQSKTLSHAIWKVQMDNQQFCCNTVILTQFAAPNLNSGSVSETFLYELFQDYQMKQILIVAKRNSTIYDLVTKI